LDLSKILASSCRQKILRVLSKKQTGISIMALVRAANGSYNEVCRNLKILETEGIITQKYTRSQRIISLSDKNRTTVFLLNVLENLDAYIYAIQSSNERLNSKTIKALEQKAGKNYYVQKTVDAPDVMTLLSLPKPLIKTMIALYKMDQATAEDISKETTRPWTLEKAYANQLTKQGYLKKIKVGRKMFFYIEALQN
jgi:hypothetical protein